MDFNIKNIPNEHIQLMINLKTWTEECPFAISRLKLIELSHIDFHGKICRGQIIVVDVVAEEVVKIFKKLLEIKFPINKVSLIEDYAGNDEASMEDNNSSCFNFRKIAGTSKLSLHGLGMAIDINPLQNPYLVLNRQQGILNIYPKAGIDYINRYKKFDGQVEDIKDIFKEHGFRVWGGGWQDPIDYHHFQVDRGVAEKISRLSFEEGKKLFLKQIDFG